MHYCAFEIMAPELELAYYIFKSVAFGIQPDVMPNPDEQMSEPSVITVYVIVY